MQYQAAGFPDLLAVHPVAGVAVAMECKSATGTLSTGQVDWLEDLNAAGIESWTVNPATYHQTIDRLQAMTRPAAQLELETS